MIHKPRQTKDLFSCFNNKDIEALEEEIIALFLNREYDMLIENFDSFIQMFRENSLLYLGGR